jgi:hypothetical protein
MGLSWSNGASYFEVAKGPRLSRSEGDGMSVHIGRWRNHELRPICGFKGNATMCSDSWESIDKIADCEDCVSEYLREKCSLCDGNGVIPGGCDCRGRYQCQHCKVENFFEDRNREPGIEVAAPTGKGE